MTWMATWDTLAPALHAGLGGVEAVTLRSYTLRDRGTGRAAVVVVSGSHSAGASTLSLKSSTGANLQGEIPTNLVVTAGGMDYTNQAEVDAAGGTSTVTLSIDPMLAGALADGDPVTLASAVTYTFTVGQGGAIVSDLKVEDIPEALVGQVTSRIALCKRNAPTTPRRGDVLRAGGTKYLVREIEREWSGGWDLLGGST